MQPKCILLSILTVTVLMAVQVGLAIDKSEFLKPIQPVLIGAVAKGGSYVMHSKFGFSQKNADITCAAAIVSCTVTYPIIRTVIESCFIDGKTRRISWDGLALHVLIGQAAFWTPNILTTLKSRIWPAKAPESNTAASADSVQGQATSLQDFLTRKPGTTHSIK